MFDETAWLEKLSPGDDVIFSDGKYRRIVKVKSVSPKTRSITLQNGVRFNRRGRQTGVDTWARNHSSIEEATEEALAEYRHFKAVAHVKRELHEISAALNGIKPSCWSTLHVNQVNSINRQIKSILEQITQCQS